MMTADQIREGFYHRDLSADRRDSISFRRDGFGQYVVMRSALRSEGGSWSFVGPVYTLLHTRNLAEAQERVRSLITSGEWRWASSLR